MALILAIESDKRQVNYLTAMVRGKLHAELVLGDTAEGALDRLGDRVPDLILTSALLSPRDEQALSDRLRRLNGVAAHVQMLTLPVFAPPARQSAPQRGGVLSALLGDRSQPAAPDGCDPAVFAEQCKEYLRRAADEREARRHGDSPEPLSVDSIEPVSVDTFEPVLLEEAADFAAELALDQAMERPAEPVAEPIAEEVTEQVAAPNDAATLDVDLSSLLEEVRPEQPEPAVTFASPEEEEPAVYELSADAIDMEAAIELSAPLAVAASPDGPAEVASPADDFNEWQNVIDALKRESAQVRVPRARKTQPRPIPTSAPAPVAASPTPKTATEPPRRRRATRNAWRTFDPAEAGMSALYERLRQLERDDERS